jgi:nucleoside-diphosphate-sugar epimerase
MYTAAADGMNFLPTGFIGSHPDITKARELLGWQPTIGLAEGLPPTIEYFRGFV